MTEKRGLGRGLDALFGDGEALLPSSNASATVPNAQRKTVPITSLKPNADQPRREFDDTQLEELANSIREHGIIQPILVRPHPEQSSMYEIVAGERRYRAAQRARLHDVPVIVQFLSDEKAAEIALIENLQRADLNALEEAQGYKSLMDQYGHTQDSVAERLGKSRSHVANLLRLLNLPTGVQGLVRDGTISTGHAKLLLTSPDPVGLAQKIAEDNLSVRAAERAAKVQKSRRKKTVTTDDKSPDLKALEHRLSLAMGCRVQVRGNNGTGSIVLNYSNLDQLDEIISKIES